MSSLRVFLLLSLVRALPSLAQVTGVANPSDPIYIDNVNYSANIAGIQSAAMAADTRNGGKVIVPAGTYFGDATLDIPANVTVECGGWDTILSFTGNNTAIKLGDHSVLRNCKVDASGATPIQEIEADGNDSLLDHNWIVGTATDSQRTHLIRLIGARPKSRSNKYDSVSEVALQGVGARSTNDTFVNFRTGIFVVNTSNFLIQATHCVSVAGSGIIAGMDCVVVEGSTDGEIHNPNIEAAREHGVYIGAKGRGRTECRRIKIIDGTCTGQPGACYKVRGDSVSSPDTDIQFVNTSSDTGGAGTSEGILISNASNVTVTGGSARREAFGIEIGGGSDITVTDFHADSNTGDGLRIRDYDGPITRVRVIGGKYNNNSFGTVANFAAIEVRPDNGGVTGGTNIISDIAFDGVECSDTQGAHTQNHCIQLDTAQNGSSVTRLRVSNVRGQGNVGILVTSVPAKGYTFVGTR